MKNTVLREQRLERLEIANAVIESIATTGRKMLGYGGRSGYLKLDDRGRCWYVDPYKQKEVYTHYSGDWKGFSSGGTMRSLVIVLSKFVLQGEKIDLCHFGYRPYWYCQGQDIWGYGVELLKVWVAAKPLLVDPDNLSEYFAKMKIESTNKEKIST